MEVLKSGKYIMGARFTAAEKKALDMETRRQFAEYARKHELEMEALVIWQLRQIMGWGETRLKRFYDQFDIALDRLIEHYEAGSDDVQWLCTKKLKDEGIDLEAWRREKYPNLKYEVRRN